VHNEFLPIEFQGRVFLSPEGDTSEKIWDERLLMRWEMRENGGKEWEGRKLDDREGKQNEQGQVKYEWSC
jgi:putative ATPase